HQVASFLPSDPRTSDSDSRIFTVQVTLLVKNPELSTEKAQKPVSGSSNDFPLPEIEILARYQYYNNHDDQSPDNVDYYYNSYDTGEDIDPPDDAYTLPSTIACFSCTLVQRDGHVQGMENCGDPFIRLDIPSVDCKGPCGPRSDYRIPDLRPSSRPGSASPGRRRYPTYCPHRCLKTELQNVDRPSATVASGRICDEIYAGCRSVVRCALVAPSSSPLVMRTKNGAGAL
ncbi:hypothetical protein LSH36_780g02020, partial [Paralvinella palmiformis]